MSVVAFANGLDRRRADRFPFACDLRYRTLDRMHQVGGVGQTINMSRNGVLIATKHTISRGERVEVSISWPAKRDHDHPVRLTVTATVAWARNGKVGLAMRRHKFGTDETGPGDR